MINVFEDGIIFFFGIKTRDKEHEQIDGEIERGGKKAAKERLE